MSKLILGILLGNLMAGVFGLYLVHTANAQVLKNESGMSNLLYEQEKVAVCPDTATTPYLKRGQTVAPQWDFGPERFYRNDDVGHKCIYENNWMGNHQFIFAEYCLAVPFDGNFYDENSTKPI